MQLEDYTTGTVSISNGSAALTGTGTAWDVAGFKAGDTFHAQGLTGIIASVDSDTAITLRDLWAGTSIVGGAYLLRYQPDNSRMQGTTRQLLDQLRAGIWLTPDATGKTADKATYDARPAGFRFLDVSVDPFKLYVKESDTSGDWSSGADWVGPQGQPGADGSPDGGRQTLTANRTYYVATTGSDSNDGLTSGTAFATLSKAILTAYSIDLSIYNVTIQVTAGTYTSGFTVESRHVGSGSITILGNTTTPSNVLINVSPGSAFNVRGGASLIFQGLKIQASAYAFTCSTNSRLRYSNIDFGTSAIHILVESGGVVENIGNYTISGGAQSHWNAGNGGIVQAIFGATITLLGTPAFSTAFARGHTGAAMQVNTNTFVGSATGKRYDVSANAVVQTFGGGASYLPGSIDGTTATGGQYV